MRDPVDRCVSASRMIIRNSNSELSLKAEIAHIQQNYKSTSSIVRTRYDLTINTIEQVFHPNEIHYAFFEDFFTEESIKSLCDFIGISFTPPNFSLVPNKSKTDNILPKKLLTEIAMFYEPVYEFISNRFEDKMAHDIWGKYY